MFSAEEDVFKRSSEYREILDAFDDAVTDDVVCQIHCKAGVNRIIFRDGTFRGYFPAQNLKIGFSLSSLTVWDLCWPGDVSQIGSRGDGSGYSGNRVTDSQPTGMIVVEACVVGGETDYGTRRSHGGQETLGLGNPRIKIRGGVPGVDRDYETVEGVYRNRLVNRLPISVSGGYRQLSSPGRNGDHF